MWTSLKELVGPMRKNWMAFFSAFLILSVATEASALQKPTGRVVLRVTGAIDVKNEADGAAFDAAMLEELGAKELRLETPWTTGTNSFTGPLLRDVLDAVGAKGETLKFSALNGYQVRIPYSDSKEFNTVLAIKLNEKPMSVRDKGPIFLVYPFNENPSLWAEKYFSRSIWQVTTIEVMP